MAVYKIALIPGDGIGPEVIREAVKSLTLMIFANTQKKK